MNAHVHEKVLVLFRESFNATTIFLQSHNFLLDVFQEVRVGRKKLKLPYMASTCCCDLLSQLNLTNSSATQNHVVFQPTSEQAKYGASNMLKKQKGFCSFPLRLKIGEFFVEKKLCFGFNTVYRSLTCEQRYKKTYEA